MASSAHRLGANHRDTLIKAAGLRLSDVGSRDTTDYAEIIVGDGAPSGGYGRHSGATLVYLRKDASSVGASVYVSVNGGTAWSAVQAGADAAVTAASVAIVDAGTLYTATDVEAALAEVKVIADDAVPRSRCLQAVITVADATGGATAAALTLTLTELGGGAITSPREVLIVAKAGATPYRPWDSPPDVTSVTYSAATTGTLVASGLGWALVRTDAAGAFACTVSNSDDETIAFAAITPQGVSNLSYQCVVSGCVPDSATWAP